MDKSITEQQFKNLAAKYGIPYAALRAVAEVEGSGHGFDAATGKILIQFEPLWMKRRYADWLKDPNSIWVSNRVGVQSVEWEAFNDAFADNAVAAMESTSIGMMQVMGFHWKALGFGSVGDMWDFAKGSEANQLELGIMFIKTNRLIPALQNQDWATFAKVYNGEGYKSFKYDTRLASAYKKFA